MAKKMIGILLVLILAGLGVFLFLGSAPALHEPSDLSDLIGTPDSPIIITDISAIEGEVTVERDVAVVVRDGTRLSANVFRPKAPGQA